MQLRHTHLDEQIATRLESPQFCNVKGDSQELRSVVTCYCKSFVGFRQCLFFRARLDDSSAGSKQ